MLTKTFFKRKSSIGVKYCLLKAQNKTQAFVAKKVNISHCQLFFALWLLLRSWNYWYRQISDTKSLGRNTMSNNNVRRHALYARWQPKQSSSNFEELHCPGMKYCKGDHKGYLYPQAGSQYRPFSCMFCYPHTKTLVSAMLDRTSELLTVKSIFIWQFSWSCLGLFPYVGREFEAWLKTVLDLACLIFSWRERVWKYIW